MANEKVWTEAQREAATALCEKRIYAFQNHGCKEHVIDIQCELTEAREIIGDCVYFGDWDKLNAWLKRNTGGSDGR